MAKFSLGEIKNKHDIPGNLRGASFKQKLRRFLRANGTRVGHVDRAIISQIRAGKYPEWMEALIDFDANPVNPMTEIEFCKVYNIKCAKTLDAYRRAYPNYDIAVAYRRRKFTAHMGNYLMRVLVKRAIHSDSALKIGLEIAGEYTPTTKTTVGVSEDVPTELKKRKIQNLLEKLNLTTKPMPESEKLNELEQAQSK